MAETVTADGIHLSSGLLAELGWPEGQLVEVQVADNRITIVPSAEVERAIIRNSLSHLLERVGDATTIGRPRRLAHGWEVPVFLSYKDIHLGTLVFSPLGELLAERSTPPEAMRAASQPV